MSGATRARPGNTKSEQAQVTVAEYDPDDGLRELLDEVLSDATVSYGDEQDLTAEWYQQEAAEMRLSESRLEKRIGDFNHEPIGFGQLERYARVWLSAGGE